MAPVGQALTHQGFSQWKQAMKTKVPLGTPSTIFGSMGTIRFGLGPTGNDLMLLQAT